MTTPTPAGPPLATAPPPTMIRTDTQHGAVVAGGADTAGTRPGSWRLRWARLPLVNLTGARVLVFVLVLLVLGAAGADPR